MITVVSCKFIVNKIVLSFTREQVVWWSCTHIYEQQISCLTVSKVLDRFDRLGQVAEELVHAGGEERVDHGAGQEAPQICLEEGEHLGAVGFPEYSEKEKHNPKANKQSKKQKKADVVDSVAVRAPMVAVICVSVIQRIAFNLNIVLKGGHGAS